MSEQDRPGPPDDEPLIGGTSSESPPPAGGPPSPPPRDPGQGGQVIGVPPEPPPRTVDPWESQHLRRSAPDLRTYGRDGPRAGYYGATRRSVGRTAAAYFFTLAALVIGGILIFLLFQVLSDNGDEPIEPTPVAITPEARIESPPPGFRHPVDEPLSVIASVTSGEDLVRFELLVSDIINDEALSGRLTGENTYAVVLTARFQATGAYSLVVRAETVSGEQVETPAIQVIVFQPETATPVPTVTAEVVGLTELRTGPSGEYNQAGDLEPGQIVTVTGRTRDQQWLQLENGLWVRLSAVDIDPRDLALLPDVDPPPPPSPTPTPPPATPTPTGTTDGDGDGETDGTTTPTATPTSTAPLNAPDFLPTNAVLLDRGATLRVTITNKSTNPFSGAIVVRVERVFDDPELDTVPVELADNLSIEPNDTAALNFTMAPPVMTQITVRVTVDPDDAIAESSEDNNEIEFIVVPPPEGPDLSLMAEVAGDALRVTISNAGDTLSTSDARLVISVPGETTTRTISPLVIGEGESVEVDDIAVPQTGEAIRVTLFIDGVNEGSVSVPNPNVVDVPPDTGDDGDDGDDGDGDGEEGPTEPDLGDGS